MDAISTEHLTFDPEAKMQAFPRDRDAFRPRWKKTSHYPYWQRASLGVCAGAGLGFTGIMIGYVVLRMLH